MTLRSRKLPTLGSIITFFMVGAIVLILTGTAHSAGVVSLAWNANTDPDISGYKVYYGTRSRIYSTIVNIGNFTGCTISGLTAGLTYYFAATAYIKGGLESNYSTELSYTVPSAVGSPSFFAVNTGGAKYTTTGGVIYSADTQYSGGWTYTTGATITGTSDIMLYRSQRVGNFSYNIPLTNGNYYVTLKFAELYFTSKGQRVFDVLAGSKVVISHLDIYAVAGANKAYDVKIPVTVTNGTLTLQFRPVVYYPVVNAIMVAK